MQQFRFLIWCCLLPGLLSAQQRAVWHHSASLYRACYSYAGGELPAETGLVLEVPVCGLGQEDGRDIICFDDRGRQILSQPAGRGRLNQAVLLCRPEANAKNIYAYFASGSVAPAARIPQWCGLLCEIRTLPEGPAENWKQVSSLLEKSQLLAVFPVEDPAQVCNPLDSRDKFIMILRGFLNFPQAAGRTYFVAADDAGYLLIDNALQIERNGRNYVHSSLRAEFRKELNFTAGLHRLDLVGVNFSGNFAVALGQLPGGNTVANVTGKAFLPARNAVLLDVENKHADRGNPAFSYRHLSYLCIGERVFTETEVETCSRQPANIEFADGIQLRGGKVKRIFASLQSCPLQVTVKRDSAKGRIDFPESAPPERLLPENPQHFQHYFQSITQMNLQDLRDGDTLLGFLEFLLRREFCPEQIPVCERLLKLRKMPPGTEGLALQSLARSAAGPAPEKATQAYLRLLEEAPGRQERESVLLEAMDFALFRLRDFSLAERWLNQYGRRQGKNSRAALLLRLDLALQQGDAAAARRHYQSLLDSQEYSGEQRSIAVRGNAARERLEMLLQEDQLLESWLQLHRLALLDPTSRGNGSFSLLRARLFRKMGWLSGALGELEGAILFEPLLPNLPEIEFQRAEIHAAAGEKEKAEELFRKISSEYPNHPLAASAKQKLAK